VLTFSWQRLQPGVVRDRDPQLRIFPSAEKTPLRLFRLRAHRERLELAAELQPFTFAARRPRGR
jgi:hypothetical protein